MEKLPTQRFIAIRKIVHERILKKSHRIVSLSSSVAVRTLHVGARGTVAFVPEIA